MKIHRYKKFFSMILTFILCCSYFVLSINNQKVISAASVLQQELKQNVCFENHLIVHDDSILDWQVNYHGDTWAEGLFVQELDDGGYVIFGTKNTLDRGNDFWLIKTDMNGTELWSKTYGDTNENRGVDAQQTVDGGFILMGSTKPHSVDDLYIWLVKTDENGVEQWNKTFGEMGQGHYGYSIYQTNDGGYIITGFEVLSSSLWDLYILRIDVMGNKMWDTTFGCEKPFEIGIDVQQTSDNGFIVLGVTTKNVQGYIDIWLIKTDEHGTEQWNKTYGKNKSDFGYSIQQTIDGGYIFTGKIEIGDNECVWLVKTDVNGVEQWNKTFYDHLYPRALSLGFGINVQQTSDGGYIIFAGTHMMIPDIWLIKTDSEGNKEWDYVYDTPYCPDFFNKGQPGQLTRDGGFILLRNVGDQEHCEIWLMKLKNFTKPQLEITVTGGFTLNISITNIGDVPIRNIQWQLQFQNASILRPKNGYCSGGTDGFIPLDAHTTIFRTITVRGFAGILRSSVIHLTATSDINQKIDLIIPVKVLLCYTFIYRG